MDICPRETVRSDFWWQVKALLEMPYDQREYTGLLEAVKSRKPILKDKDLRNGKFYLSRRLGKSYLDHYKGQIFTFQSFGATPPCLVPMVYVQQCLVHRHSDFFEHLQICSSNFCN